MARDRENLGAACGEGSSTRWRCNGSLTGQLLDLIAADPSLGPPLAGATTTRGRGGLDAVTSEGAKAPGRRADQAQLHLDRDLGSRPVGRGGGRGARWPGR